MAEKHPTYFILEFDCEFQRLDQIHSKALHQKLQDALQLALESDVVLREVRTIQLAIGEGCEHPEHQPGYRDPRRN